MDATRINKKKLIKEYINNVSQKISVDKVIFFGSGVRRQLTEDSDLDFIVLSNDFRKMKFMDRLVLLSQARNGLSETVPMDILGYTPEEFEKLSSADESVVLSEAKREGKVVYSK